MKLEHWRTVLQSYGQVRNLLDQWLPAEQASGTGRAMARVGHLGLAQLQDQLLGVVDTLKAGLGTGYRTTEVEEALRPFVYLVDELVLRRLADGDQPDWPMLQHRLFGESEGGDLFYELADRKLLRPDPSPLVYELLHFSLTAGFGGRHLGNVAKLREYKDRLAVIIPKPEIAPVAQPPAPSEPTALHEFPVRYYAVTAFIVLALPVTLWWLSR